MAARDRSQSPTSKRDEHIAVNQKVYYMHPTRGWAVGTLVERGDQKVTVQDRESRAMEKVPPSSLHIYMDGAYSIDDDELFRISDLHVAPILFCIAERYEKKQQQYSRMGEIILSVNPFQRMPYNSDEEQRKYLDAPDVAKLSPHAWQAADKAFKDAFMRKLGNQSIVISGESGSGKTENTKTIIRYIGEMSLRQSRGTMRTSVDRMGDLLNWSNPIMESFGNARTVRNDNSSRFGKYTKLYFEANTGALIGGEVQTFLLEKSRISRHGKGERNYHIFYEMLAGLSAEQKAQLGGLKSAESYACLYVGGITTRRGVDGQQINDADEYQSIMKAFRVLGVSSETVGAILRCLAAILHLSEITFTSDANDKAVIADRTQLDKACRLLQVNPQATEELFLVKSKTKLLTTLTNVVEATAQRDSFMRLLYTGVFDWIVDTVNKAIAPKTTPDKSVYIGVLDIFGFENFTVNSFEQLCINFANETLAGHYNKNVFEADEEECRQEGIPFPKVNVPDNRQCLEMLSSAKVGVFALLDEECNFKGGTTDRFTSNVWEQWTKCEYLIRPKSTIPEEFGVRHYASPVMYKTPGWLEKNTDVTKDDSSAVMAASADAFLKKLSFATSVGGGNDSARKRVVSVSGYFRTQLQMLQSELESTASHFVRCVKPNMLAAPNQLDKLHVGSQLESAGVLQTIEMKRAGYPVRRPIAAFVHYYHIIAPTKAIPLIKARRDREACAAMFDYYQRIFKWTPPHYAIGNTKVFMRSHVSLQLERMLFRRRRVCFGRCVHFLRRWARRFREKKEERLFEEMMLAEKRRAEEQARREAMEANPPRHILDLLADMELVPEDSFYAPRRVELPQHHSDDEAPVIPRVTLPSRPPSPEW